MCKLCERKPVDTGNKWCSWENEFLLQDGGYTFLRMGVDCDSQIYLVASGEDEAIWYPNFCPICGRPLRGHRRYTPAIDEAPMEELV